MKSKRSNPPKTSESLKDEPTWPGPDALRRRESLGKVPASPSGLGVRTSLRDERLSGLWTQNQVGLVNKAARDFITPEIFQTLDALQDKTPKVLRIGRSRGGKRINPHCINAAHIWVNGIYQIKVPKGSRKTHEKLLRSFKSIGNNVLECRAPIRKEYAVPLVRALLHSKAVCVNTFGPFFHAMRCGNHFLKRLDTFCAGGGGTLSNREDNFSSSSASGQTVLIGRSAV